MYARGLGLGVVFLHKHCFLDLACLPSDHQRSPTPILLFNKELCHFVLSTCNISFIKLLTWERDTHVHSLFLLEVFSTCLHLIQSSQYMECGGDVPHISYVAPLE